MAGRNLSGSHRSAQKKTSYVTMWSRISVLKMRKVRLMSRWNLGGKVALVTGASGGLGAHFAKVLARAGAEVILGARREEAMAEVAETIRAAGGTCSTVP